MRRTALVVLLAALVACSSNGSTKVATGTPSTSPKPSASTAPLPFLVGKWELKRTCVAIVKALTQAGFADLIPQDVVELIKGVPVNGTLPATWDPAQPCADAKPPIEHSHTFWPDGSFNSYDQNDQQVDDGQYTLVDDHTFIFPGAISITMHCRIKGDTIMFDPMIPKNCSTTKCRDAIGYAFAVAYPGQTWTRATSGPNVPTGSVGSG
jgi:hypothetical protein